MLRWGTDRLRTLLSAATHAESRHREQLDAVRALTDEVRRMRAEVDDLAATVDLVARARAVPTPARVVFLVHNVAAWDVLHGLYAAMLRSPEFAPVVATVPRRFVASDRFGDEDVNHADLERRGVAHLRFDADDDGERALALLRRLAPHVVVRQSQWDADVQPALAAARLDFTRLVYVPYELVNLVQNVPRADGRDSAVVEPLLEAAWRVYATPAMCRRAAAADALGAPNWVATGHPKLPAIRAAAPAWPFDRPRGDGRRQRVVFAFHHSIGEHWTRFGTFPTVAADALAWARARTDLEFVVCTHPALAAVVAEQSEHTRIWEEFHVAWLAMPNTALVPAGSSYLGVLAAADVLVTDGLSPLIDGPVAGVPTVWIERADHRPLTPEGERVADAVHRVADVGAARAVVERLLAGPDPLAETQHRVVREVLGGGDPVPSIMADLRAALTVGERPAATA